MFEDFIKIKTNKTQLNYKDFKQELQTIENIDSYINPKYIRSMDGYQIVFNNGIKLKISKNSEVIEPCANTNKYTDYLIKETQLNGAKFVSGKSGIYYIRILPDNTEEVCIGSQVFRFREFCGI